jgi:hypothetical protein
MKIISLVGEPYKVCGVWYQEVRREGISGTSILLKSQVALILHLQGFIDNQEDILKVMYLADNYAHERELENQID